MALFMAILASSLLLTNQAMGAPMTVGLTLLGISLVIGVKSLVDMYAKLIGVSSLLDNGPNANQNDLS